MRRFIIAVVVVLCILTGFAAQPTRARAASAPSFTLSVTCTGVSFTVNSTGPNPLILIGVWEVETDKELAYNNNYARSISRSYSTAPGTLVEVAYYYEEDGVPLLDDDFIVNCGDPGPSVPTNADGTPFTQKTIVCDVAVFDKAGGQPVGTNAVKQQQVFYVGKDVTTVGGKGWVKIYVGSPTLPWIPSSCAK